MQVMKKISSAINLTTLGIRVVTTRPTRAGGILIEVEDEEKATLLAEKVRELVGDGARVRQPQGLTPVLLLDVPEWVAKEEIVEGIRKAGVSAGVDEAATVSTWKNSGSRGGYVARVNLPYKEAIKLVEAKAVTIGWTRCRVKPIERAQPSCYRCQERGHFASECKNPAKSRRCHGCGDKDHLLRDCRQPGKAAEKSNRGAETEEGGPGSSKDCGDKTPGKAKGKPQAPIEVREVVPPPEAPAVQTRRDD